ncbi:MAG: hypothetical protein WCF23_12450 [Candidatus Nitrosopolaris sp.]
MRNSYLALAKYAQSFDAKCFSRPSTFDHSGVLWFTGQSGIYGRLDPSMGQVEVFKAPSGPGPYGITTTVT